MKTLLLSLISFGLAVCSSASLGEMGTKESNAIGNIISNRILKIVSDLGDPYVLIGQDGIGIPVNISSDLINIQGAVNVSSVTTCPSCSTESCLDEYLPVT